MGFNKLITVVFLDNNGWVSLCVSESWQWICFVSFFLSFFLFLFLLLFVITVSIFSDSSVSALVVDFWESFFLYYSIGVVSISDSCLALNVFFWQQQVPVSDGKSVFHSCDSVVSSRNVPLFLTVPSPPQFLIAVCLCLQLVLRTLSATAAHGPVTVPVSTCSHVTTWMARAIARQAGKAVPVTTT